MIHGGRQSRAAAQSRALVVAGAVLVAIAVAALASGAATAELAFPWKTVAVLAVAAVVLAGRRARGRR